MPLAARSSSLARLGGGTEAGARSDYSTLFLVLHVGLVSLAFAGVHARGRRSSALYLWQERRLKHRAPGVLLGRAPVAADARAADRRGRSPSRCPR